MVAKRRKFEVIRGGPVSSEKAQFLQFGDQLGDFAEILANTPAGRQQLLDEYRDWFGERWWMLPNPTYGSWEPAIFNNDWTQPRAARRQAKREALNLAN